MTNQNIRILPLAFGIILVTWICARDLQSQDMQEGYQMLESGQFASAEIFFQEILEEYPDNRTARLCYARAVGLHDDPARSITLFTTLIDDYPDDKEVNINLAESYLWNQDYSVGQTHYESLYELYPEDISILVGLANSHALQQQYSDSYLYLEKAMKIDSSHAGASNSMQFTRLGLASEAMNAFDYDRAENLLADNLNLDVDLTPTYLNQANLALNQNEASSAHAIFQSIVELDSTNIAAINGLSLTHYLLDHPRKSRTYAEKAMQLIKETDGQSLRQATVVHYLQSLIWSHDYDLANSEANFHYDNGSIDTQPYLALQSRSAMQQKRYHQATHHYRQLVDSDDQSTEGWIGIVQSQIASDSIRQAASSIQLAEQQIGNHPTLSQLDQHIDNLFKLKLNNHTYYNLDSADDQAVNIGLAPVIPLGEKIAILASYQYRATSNLETPSNNGTQVFQSGLRYRLRPHTLLSGQVGVVQSIKTIGDVGNILSTDLTLQSKLRLHDIKIGYRSGLQDYNTNLIDSRIAYQKGYLTYSFATLKGFGIYSELHQNFFSDENSSTLGLLSFYQQVKRRPFLKLGVNLQYLSFRESRPATYFSPEQFYTSEVFVDLVRSEDMFLGKGVTYLATGATGLQVIEDAVSSTYRLHLSLGYRWESGVGVSIYGLRSNVATSSFGGFTYNEGGVKATLYLTKNPIVKVN